MQSVILREKVPFWTVFFNFHHILSSPFSLDIKIFPETMSLLNAAKSGSTEICELLLEAGGDVGERDKNGRMPLLMADYIGHAEVCELLLERGKANIEETTRLGNTALIIPWAHATMYKAKVLLSIIVSRAY